LGNSNKLSYLHHFFFKKQFSNNIFFQRSEIMFKFLFLILVSLSVQAEIKELAPGLTVDTNNYTLALVDCGGVPTPGVQCIQQCYQLDNTIMPNSYTCNLEATASFSEQLSTNPPEYTGNTLTATDYRSVRVYPYQMVKVCFNYGKEIIPGTMWSIIEGSGSITTTGNCTGGSTVPLE
jgi:hypothetical protein